MSNVSRLLRLAPVAALITSTYAVAQPHVVFVTFDDLNLNSLGAYGNQLEDITPNLDRLANEGMRFNNFHVMAANCTPSRAFMMTGMYQQNSRIFSLGKAGAGNHTLRNTMPAVFQAAGYHTGVMGKNPHQMPFEPHSSWDVEYDGYSSTRVPSNIYDKMMAAIEDAKESDQPLFFNLNIFDPHTPFYGWHPRKGSIEETGNHPSRIYTADEVPYPSWFPVLPEYARVGTTRDGVENVHMLDEVAAYYNTVKRGDDSTGAMIQALIDGGIYDDTMIVVISDHGAQLPGAKTSLYNHGTASPLIVRWPGVVEAGSVNDEHMVGSIDLVPTFSEVVGQPIPMEVDGRSFLPMLHQEEVGPWREFVYKQQNDRNPSRAIQTTDSLYILNAWANGSQRFGSVTTGMFTWRMFKEAAANPELAPIVEDWVNRIEYRMPEEFYDVANDPDNLYNLIDDPAYADEIARLRQMMLDEAVTTGDDLFVPAIQDPQNHEVLASVIDAQKQFHADQRNDPNYLRVVNYDPLDGWMVIGNTIFEPFGEWGIWKSTGAGVGLTKNNGERNMGPSAVEFDGKKLAENAFLATAESFDGSVFEQIKLELLVPNHQKFERRGRVDRKTELFKSSQLNVVYHDGNEWQKAASVKGNRITGEHSWTLDAPAGGFPTDMRIGIQVQFNGDGGYVTVDSVRLSGWQDWQQVTGWSASNKPVDNAFSLTTSTPEVELSGALKGQEMGQLELSYEFRGQNISGSDRLLVEMADENGWKSIQVHNFDYVMLQGSAYKGMIELTSPLPAQTKLRFRLDSNAANAAIAINDVMLKTRSAF
ncbi:sulfatase [Ferrimonas pelagia]|uniref:Sulfatase N-terminal domain-containing protein n=1 Tax=Ferrimonas pelagia TaxID=1177826 RepID=A0ABP9FEP1_9GAMM